MLSRRSKDKASCHHQAFGFLTFLKSSFAQDLVELGLLFPDLHTDLEDITCSMNMTAASRVPTQHWRRKELSSSSKTVEQP